MGARGRVISAVFQREFFSYFTNPTGYVFITLFVFLSALAAFWQEQFFQNNLANLEQLNRLFPYLLIFLIPSITMGLWADERRSGTEELVLTLPASNAEILLGKFLAALGIYTVALLFSLSHVVVLAWLGNPDPGMILATYAGYWLLGAALLPLGLLASQITENLTIAFIIGAVLCAIPVFLRHAGAILSGTQRRLAEQLSASAQFGDLSAGIVTTSAVVYFLGLTLAVLYLNTALVGRRRWPTRKGAVRLGPHYVLRTLALLVVVASVTLAAARFGTRIDATWEKIYSLSPQTRALIDSLDPQRPVFITAYVSPEVPRSYLPIRNNLLSFLREFSAAGGEKVQTQVIDTRKYSPAAREARERFGIEPFRVPVTEESASVVNEIFLGLVFTCAGEEFVIPFFDRGLPVEYELMRSIRVVSRAERRKAGILQTGARLFGSFDFQSRRQTEDWAIVGELKKQYAVEQVSPDTDYPEDLDVLIAVLPTTLTTAQLDRLTAYAQSGKPLLIALDPLPAFNLNLSPQAQAQPADSPFSAAPAQPSSLPNLTPFLRAIGIEWSYDRVAWDTYNPHPQLRSLPPEVVFVGKGSQATMPFQTEDEITNGLQEVVMLYPGHLRPREDGKTTFVPLMTTGKDSGTLRWNQLVQRTILGTSIVQGLPHNPDKDELVLAARVTREGDQPLNAVVLADADLMGQEFFELRRRGVENLNLDNVTFILNAVDELAGDRSFIALRKRRPRLRTLEALERRTQVYEERRRQEVQNAQALADQRLREAQARLDTAVAALRVRTDLDEQAKEIMISNVQAAENRRLQVARANIEEAQRRQMDDARAAMEQSVRDVQNTIKLLAVALPPIPAFVLFVFVSIRKLRRERSRISIERLLEKEAA
jgi:ABC-2 type transport system permease protein